MTINRAENNIKSRSFPRRFTTPAAFDELVRHGVVGQLAPAAPLLDARTPLTTVGSCFAANVAKHLGKLNYDILRLGIADRLFSPTALQFFFENLNGDVSIYQKHWNVEQEVIDQLRARLTAGGVIIITFGMSAVWKDQNTGEYVLDPAIKHKTQLLRPSSGFQMVQTSLDENIEAINMMINAIKRLNRANKIIMTLSPIPMIYADHNPVVVADCVSKTTLRVALDEVMRAGLSNVHYFPSFELLKWLAPMTDTIWFEDDMIAHIRNDWIAYTMGVFSEFYCADRLPKVLPVSVFPGADSSSDASNTESGDDLA